MRGLDCGFITRDMSNATNAAPSDAISQAWATWATQGRTERRRLIVQIINAERLAYAWQSFDVALQNIRFMGVPPTLAGEAIASAVKLAERTDWSPAAIRAALR